MTASFDRLLTFSTTFRVVAAEQAVRQAGIRCGLTPTPAGVHSACGLSLRLAQADIDRALQVVADAGLPVEGCWQADESDGWRRTTLPGERPD